jgi:hypothetical protein
MENKEQKEFAYNLYGVKVKKCCASCEWRCPDAGHMDAKTKPRRICMKGHGVHYSDYLCTDWRMEETCKDKNPRVSLQTMRPIGNGRVKSPAYIKFVQLKLQELDNELTASGMSSKMCNNIQKEKMQQWTVEYEQLYGSRYL